MEIPKYLGKAQDLVTYDPPPVLPEWIAKNLKACEQWHDRKLEEAVGWTPILVGVGGIVGAVALAYWLHDNEESSLLFNAGIGLICAGSAVAIAHQEHTFRLERAEEDLFGEYDQRRQDLIDAVKDDYRDKLDELSRNGLGDDKIKEIEAKLKAGLHKLGLSVGNFESRSSETVDTDSDESGSKN